LREQERIWLGFAFGYVMIELSEFLVVIE
jgi:hypothetical protein